VLKTLTPRTNTTNLNCQSTLLGSNIAMNPMSKEKIQGLDLNVYLTNLAIEKKTEMNLESMKNSNPKKSHLYQDQEIMKINFTKLKIRMQCGNLDHRIDLTRWIKTLNVFLVQDYKTTTRNSRASMYR